MSDSEVAKADAAPGVDQGAADFLATMPEYQRLRARHARFVAELIRDWHQTRAAIRAGYPAGRARITGSQLASRMDVAAVLAKYRQYMTLQAQVPLEQHLSDLKSLREEARGEKQFTAAVKAEEARGKAVGHYEPKYKQRRPLEGVSDTELAERAARILGIPVEQAMKRLED